MLLHYRSENTVQLRTPLTHAVKPSLYLDFQFLQSFTFIGQILMCVAILSLFHICFWDKIHPQNAHYRQKKDCFTRFLISGICLFVHKGIKLHYKPGFWAKKIVCLYYLYLGWMTNGTNYRNNLNYKILFLRTCGKDMKWLFLFSI